MRRGAIGILALLFSIAAGAETELKHLGSPPPGMVFLELQTQLSTAPLQLAGTVSPPSLLLNGKPLQLQAAEKPAFAEADAIDGPAVWINGKRKPAEGEIGRFFVKLTGAEAAVPTLEITTKSADGQFLRATAAVNRTFLDAPIQVKQTKPGTETPRENIAFQLSGSIPVGAQLAIDGAQNLPAPEGSAAIEARLPLGKSVLIARVRSSDGSERILNVAVEVSAKVFSPASPILGLALPPDHKPETSPWSVPHRGLKLRGVTNPDAALLVDGQPVDVDDDDGSFSVRVRPSARDQSIAFEVKLPGGASQKFEQPITCPDFTDMPPASDSPFQLWPGLRVSNIELSTSDSRNFLQNSLDAVVSIRWVPEDSRWSAVGSGAATIQAIGASRADSSARLLSAEISAGYDFALLPDGWHTHLLAGFTHAHMAAAGDTLSHAPYGYPHLFPSITRDLGDDGELSFALKYVPLSRSISFFNFSKRELGFAISWARDKRPERALMFALRYSNIAYDMTESLAATKHTLSIEVGTRL